MTFAARNPVGIITDLPAAEVGDAYTRGTNVLSRDGQMVRAGGWDSVFGTLAVAPKFLLFSEGPVNFWLYPGTSQIFVTDQTSQFDITPVSQTSQVLFNTWTGGNLNGLPVLNNGLDAPWSWDLQTLNVMTDLPGFPASTVIQALRPFKFNLIGMNVVTSGVDLFDQVIWSDSADPGQVPATWVPAPDNDAGSQILGATSGAIIDGAPLKGDFIIYKQHSFYVMSFVGGEFFFAFRKSSVTTGLMTRNCIVELEGQHIIFADGDLIRTDGFNIESIVDKQQRRFIFDNLNADAFETSFVGLDKTNNQVWFCFPTAPSTVPNQALVWNYRDNTFQQRTLPGISAIRRGVVDPTGATTWDSQTDDWDDALRTWSGTGSSPADFKLIMADFDTTEALEINKSLTESGVNVQSVLAKETDSLGTPFVVKNFRSIYPRVSGTAGFTVDVRIGTQMRPSDPITWAAKQTFDPATKENLNFFVSGRYLSVEFSSTGLEAWQLDGYGVEFTERSLF